MRTDGPAPQPELPTFDFIPLPISVIGTDSPTRVDLKFVPTIRNRYAIVGSSDHDEERRLGTAEFRLSHSMASNPRCAYCLLIPSHGRGDRLPSMSGVSLNSKHVVVHLVEQAATLWNRERAGDPQCHEVLLEVANLTENLPVDKYAGLHCFTRYPVPLAGITVAKFRSEGYIFRMTGEDEPKIDASLFSINVGRELARLQVARALASAFPRAQELNTIS